MPAPSLSELFWVAFDRDELAKKAAELARSNAELEQFAFVASHDLQEPLRMVNGFMDRLQEQYGHQLDDKAKQYVAFAVDGATRMSQLVHDLLRLRQPGSALPIGWFCSAPERQDIAQ